MAEVKFISSHSSPYGQPDVSSTSTDDALGLLGDVRWRLPFIYADIVSSVLALVSNVLIVAAVVRTKFALLGYRRFLLSLSTADIFMASTTVLSFFHTKMAGTYKWRLVEACGNTVLRCLTLVGYFASLLSIGGLTADNYLGIFKPLTYKSLTSGNVLVRVIAVLWAVSLLFGFIDLPITYVHYFNHNKQNAKAAQSDLSTDRLATPSPGQTMNNNNFADPTLFSWANLSLILPNVNDTQSSSIDSMDIHSIIHDVLELIEEEKDFCTYYQSNKSGVELFVIALTVPCFLLILVIYWRIFHVVMKRGVPGQRKTKRLVLTTLLLIGSFSFCWMPFVLFELYMYLQTAFSSHLAPMPKSNAKSSGKALLLNTIFNSLLMLSPLINPIIYSVRLRRVRNQLVAIITCNKRKPIKPSKRLQLRDDRWPDFVVPLRIIGPNHFELGDNDSPKQLHINQSPSSTTFSRQHTLSLSPTPSNLAVTTTPPAARNSVISTFSFSSNGMWSVGRGSQSMKPDYRCCFRGCDALFLSQAAFFRHIKSKHSDQVGVCEYCFEIYYLNQVPPRYKHVCECQPDSDDSSSFVGFEDEKCAKDRKNKSKRKANSTIAALLVKPKVQSNGRNQNQFSLSSRSEKEPTADSGVVVEETILSSKSVVRRSSLRSLAEPSKAASSNSESSPAKRNKRRLTITEMTLSSLTEEQTDYRDSDTSMRSSAHSKKADVEFTAS